MIIGYARVSSIGQRNDGNSLEDQEKKLREHGAVKVYVDAFTGTKLDRPEFSKVLSVLKDGDTLMVTKLDRISRSACDGIKLVDELLSRGITVHILNMGIMDNTPTGKLIRNIMFSFAEFERDMIVERTAEGKAIARQREGYREGRKPLEERIDLELFRVLRYDVSTGGCSVNEAISKLGISRRSWYNLLDRVS